MSTEEYPPRSYGTDVDEYATHYIQSHFPEFEDFILVRGQLSKTCLYLKRGGNNTGIEIWEPGARWWKLNNKLYSKKYLVVQDLRFGEWEMVAPPFDTLEEATKVALDLSILLGDKHEK